MTSPLRGLGIWGRRIRRAEARRYIPEPLRGWSVEQGRGGGEWDGGAGSRMQNLYEFEVATIDGNKQCLDVYRGRVLLIVNVASRCGFTPQYAGLEALYRKYRERGFMVLGFPCDQFGQQEPGDEAEIKEFC